MAEDQERPASVFAAPDQDEIIARIGAVDDDETGSHFFDERLRTRQGDGRQAFEAGLTAFAGDQAASRSAPTSLTPPAGTEASTARVSTTVSVDELLGDDAARRAFILGGPSAIR